MTDVCIGAPQAPRLPPTPEGPDFPPHLKNQFCHSPGRQALANTGAQAPPPTPESHSP
jgi:hypothetical protein